MLYDRLSPYATPSVFVSLIILIVGLSAGFQLRQIVFGDQVTTLDVRVLEVYTPADVKALFDELGDDHRTIYAWTQVTLDLAYPLAYGVFLALLIVVVYREPWARRLVMIPCLGAGADWLENATSAMLAWSYTGEVSALAWGASIFSFAKWVLGLASVAIIGVGVVLWAVYKVNKMRGSRG